MEDEDKTKEQLIKELHQRIAEFEKSETLRKRTEELLQESLSRIYSLVDAFDGLVYICSKNYEVEFANKRLIERTGYNPVGQKCYKALHDLENISSFNGETVRWEVQSPKDNHWYYIVNTPIYHTYGSVSKMAMIQDITERKLAEEELLKLRLGIERSNEAIFITDINGTIVYANPAFEKIYGYSREETLGKTPRILKSGGLSQEVYKQFWDTLLAKKVVTGELINKTKDERLLSIDGSANPILDKDGNITGFLAIQHDITERKLSEAALRESEERYRKLVEFSPDAIAIQREGKIVFINVAGAKLLGAVNPEQLIGKPVMDFVHPEYQEIAKERIRLMGEEGKNVFHTEEKFIKLDGSVINVEVIAMPFTYQGKPGIQVIIRDTTDRRRAEEALKQSEEKYRTLIDNIQDGVFIIQDGKLQFANEAFAKVGEYTVEEVIGKDFRELVAPEDLEMVTERYHRRQAGEDVPREYEFRVLHKDGKTRIFVNMNVGLITYRGRVASMGTVKDITEHKRAEEELRENEERYRRLVEFSPYAIIIHSEGKFEFLNMAGAKLFGATNPEELIGKPILQFIHPDYREKVEKGVRQLQEEGKVASLIEEKFLRLDGTVVDVEAGSIPFVYRGKQVAHGIAIDITERKRAEEKIREQAALLDKAPDAIAVIDLEYRIIYCNKSAERLYGWTAEEAIGKNAFELLYKEESPRFIEAKKSVIEKGEWNGELYQLTKDGREIIVESRWTLVLDNERGKPKSILIINTDITEKKKLEEQLLHAQRMESIGTLASGIAHDINNVLTPIMLSQELLQEKLTDEESKRLLNTIERSTQRGANLMKQVQSFAKGVEGERIALQVTGIISEIEKIAKETFPRSIEIRTDILKDLWTISGDATQLHQVVMNLCVNARDAMQEGGILSISAENLLIDEDYAHINTEAKIGPYIVITVSDTGRGIPPKIIDRIFEPFFTTKEHGKGTGLGLSTSLGIVKSHGGFITVYSEVGKGTAFKIYLPAITTPETLKAEEKQLELPAGHGDSILVVDDEDLIREMTKKTLETHGYRVITANDGKEAIILYSKYREKIKLVLMDIMMPIMDGLTSIRELHKINPELKIIAVSGLTEKDKLVKVVDAHEYAFLTKPYTTEKLLSTIYDVINTK